MMGTLFRILAVVIISLYLNAYPYNNFLADEPTQGEILSVSDENEYWLLLKRKSNIELLYHGKPGIESESSLVKQFVVKTGVEGKRPTPLPQLVHREYWLLTNKYSARDNLEIGPFFLKLDIPYSYTPPYGPEPYKECDGQCNWQTPGSFGLHGIAGDNSKLSSEDKGSSGCVRHYDGDIAYLYHILPEDKQIKYYIKDI